MARTGITFHDVRQAADALVRQGVNPTQERIRLLLGGGSFSTIAKHLRSWRADRKGEGEAADGESTGSGGAELPAPPDPVDAAVREVWEQMHAACQQAVAKAEAETAQAAEAAEAAQRAAAETVAAAQAEAAAAVARAEDACAAAEAARAEAEARAAGLTLEIATERGQRQAVLAQQEHWREVGQRAQAQADTAIGEARAAAAAAERAAQAAEARQREALAAAQEEGRRQLDAAAAHASRDRDQLLAAHAAASAQWAGERRDWEARVHEYAEVAAKERAHAQELETRLKALQADADLQGREVLALREAVRAAKVQQQTTARTAETWAHQARRAHDDQAQRIDAVAASQAKIVAMLAASARAGD